MKMMMKKRKKGEVYIHERNEKEGPTNALSAENQKKGHKCRKDNYKKEYEEANLELKEALQEIKYMKSVMVQLKEENSNLKNQLQMTSGGVPSSNFMHSSSSNYTSEGDEDGGKQHVLQPPLSSISSTNTTTSNSNTINQEQLGPPMTLVGGGSPLYIPNSSNTPGNTLNGGEGSMPQDLYFNTQYLDQFFLV